MYVEGYKKEICELLDQKKGFPRNGGSLGAVSRDYQGLIILCKCSRVLINLTINVFCDNCEIQNRILIFG